MSRMMHIYLYIYIYMCVCDPPSQIGYKDVNFTAQRLYKHPVLLSHERNGPISKYSVYFDVVRDSDSVNLKFELYQHLKRIHHPFIKDINCWSGFDEVLRFVKTEEECPDKKMDFVTRTVNLLNSPKNTRVYSAEDLLHALSWYLVSRALYIQMRDYLQLPSVSTLKKITSIAKNMHDEVLFTSIFSGLKEMQKLYTDNRRGVH